MNFTKYIFSKSIFFYANIYLKNSYSSVLTMLSNSDLCFYHFL